MSWIRAFIVRKTLWKLWLSFPTGSLGTILGGHICLFYYFDKEFLALRLLIFINYSNCWSESEFSENSLTLKSLQYVCQQTNGEEEISTNSEKNKVEKMFNMTSTSSASTLSVPTQMESDYDPLSLASNITSVQSTTKCSNGVDSSRKVSILLYMLLFLVLITPCGLPVDAQLCTIDSKMLAISMTHNATEALTSSPVPVMRSMCMLADLDVHLPPETIVNTVLIPHPLHNGASMRRFRVTDLVPISSTETSLMLHPKYSSQRRALIPVYVEDTALVVHPYFSMSTSKDLVIIPPRSILSCKIASSMESNPSDIDIDSLLLITMLDRHIKNRTIVTVYYQNIRASDTVISIKINK